MKLRIKQKNYFLLGLLSLSLLYLLFEFFFNAYAMISVDEFWFAHRIYQYKDGLPYRDFAPYKTVLGYYLLLAPMLLSHGIMSTLIFTKNSIAVLNTLILFISSLWLRRFFSPVAILISLGLLICSELMLFYSTNIRVDLLGYWFGFFSLLFLLEKRTVIAGIFIGLAFLTSQKAIWYLFASDAALLVSWLMLHRNSKYFMQIILFNFTAILIITAYLIFWSLLTDAHTVFNNVFFDAAAMYQLDWYDHARRLYWSIITLYNPLLFLLWPLTLISLLVTYTNDHYARRFFILTYACVILVCLLPYKQVFPYYMQVTIPVFFILYAAFFTWLLGAFNPENHLKTRFLGNIGVWAIGVIYLILLVFVKIYASLPFPYLLLGIFPLLLCGYLTVNKINKQKKSLIFTLLMLVTAFIGIVYPLTLFSVKLINVNGAYQKANIHAAERLLHDGSDYVAGIELFYNQTQPIAGLRHLMGPAVDYLYAPSAKIRPVMLASLYEDPNATSASVIAALKNSAVKFYVNNYRMMALPPVIKHYLIANYAHLWGSIYVYTPTVLAGDHSFTLKFSGQYRIETSTPNRIVINGNIYKTPASIYLQKGKVTSKADRVYRLKFIPESKEWDSHFEKDAWEKIIF